MKLTLNISPCPNDTFMFHAMLHGLVDTEGLAFDVRFADIEEMNRAALSSTGGGTTALPAADITKLSYAVVPYVSGKYALLDSGSALGRGNGPLVVCRKGADISGEGMKMAVPGSYTTANRLVELMMPHVKDKRAVLFSEIAASVARGDFDAGVLIHEGRFTFVDHGLHLAADLGLMWEHKTGMPLPLGAIAVRRTVDPETAKAVERMIARSVRYAMENPGDSREFVAAHARELSEEVTQAHIKLFVNEFSISLGDEGRRAVEIFTGMNASKIMLP